jgi:hypothetical protein
LAIRVVRVVVVVVVVVVVLDIARRLLEGLPASEPGEIVITPVVAVTAGGAGVVVVVVVVAAAAGVLIRGRPDRVMMDVLGHGLAGVRVRGRRVWSLGGKHGAVGIQSTQHCWYAMMLSGRFQRGEAGIQVKCFTGKAFFLLVHFCFVTVVILVCE